MRPGLAAGGLVTVLLLILAALVRVLAVPKFQMTPGGLQLFLEQMVSAVDGFCRGLRALVRGLGKGLRGLGKGLAALGRGLAGLPKKLAGIHPDRRTKIFLACWIGLLAVILVAALLVGPKGGHSDVRAAMRDAVVHDELRVSLFGWKEVNPGLIAAMAVSCALLLAAALIRIFVIPRFRENPRGFQLLLEQAVSTLDGLAKVTDPGKPTFVGAYVFAAGAYIFVGTLFELFGFQALATNGSSVTLPAPLSDVNAAICMGCQSYLVILLGGVTHNGLRGAGATLKEFSLPISMSFRLFGALLSGLLVTDLVYHYAALSYGVPVVVGILFTLLHALIQTYVLTMLVGMYYEEVTEKPQREEEKQMSAA